jgi:hypothetical protein
MLSSFRAAVATARRDEQLYFAALLPEETIANALGEARELWQGWIYTPAVTATISHTVRSELLDFTAVHFEAGTNMWSRIRVRPKTGPKSNSSQVPACRWAVFSESAERPPKPGLE